jgi:hypothetical protein
VPGGTDIIQGNDLVQSLEIIANPLPGPDYEIVTPMRVWVPNERKQSESVASTKVVYESDLISSTGVS